MSARQQFQFPQAPGKPASSATFTPDPGNPLHAASQGGTTTMKEGTFLGVGAYSGMNGNDSASSQRPGTSGLGGLMKKKSHPAIGSTPASTIVRPGTADPYGRSQQPQHMNLQKARIPVLAPSPQATRHSPLLSRTSSSPRAFKIPSLIDHTPKTRKSGDNDAHISTSNGVLHLENPSAKPEHSFSMNSEQMNDAFMQVPSLKFNQGSSQVGPRRILIDGTSQPYSDIADHSASLSVPGHEINDDGRIKAANVRKRTRSDVDDDEGEYSYEKPSKRFKTHQAEDSGNENRSARNFSPHTERPSSGLSHSGDHRNLGLEVRDSPLSHHYAHLESQSRRLSVSPGAKPYTVHQSQGNERATEAPRPLAKLLGQDPDTYVQEHLQVYDQLVNKWTDCTMAEWVAGADEVASQYYKVLDYVKEHVGMKLKVYGNLHDTVNQHNVLLRKRSHVLSVAKKKLVMESGSVLGK